MNREDGLRGSPRTRRSSTDWLILMRSPQQELRGPPSQERP